MQLTGMRTKYYLLSVVAFVVLALLPTPAQAQEDPDIVKECTPNPGQVGGEITCTIDVEAAPGTIAHMVVVTDTFPAGLRVTRATGQLLFNGGPFNNPPAQLIPTCVVADNTVTCEIPFLVNVDMSNLSFEATIEARAEQCGTFPNTATATGFVFNEGEGGEPRPFSVPDTEQITVEGCGGEVAPAGGGAAPITQEGEQESEAGEIDQTFDVS